MATPKRVGRQRTQLPHCYYEGFLEKRSFKDKASRRLWTSLCGNTLFFFNKNKDNVYIEKLELCGFISLTDDGTRDRNLGAARLNLRLKDGDVKLTAPSLEARELWKGFIYSVVKLSVPSSLNLLPGQLHMLTEVVDSEKERLRTLSPRPTIASSPNLYLSLEREMPVCFQPVSRTEAMMLLERHPNQGNLLLRPGRDGSSLAITTYQDLNGPVFRHYRVTRKHNGGFAIDIETPIFCVTLNDVVDCLVEKTGGVLSPFVMEGPYDDSITFVQANKENGEKSLQSASNTSPPPLPPKPACIVGPRDLLPVPTPKADTETENDVYLNEKREALENVDVLPQSHSCLPVAKPVLSQCSLPSVTQPTFGDERRPLQPPGKRPTPTPRTFSTVSASTSRSPAPSIDTSQGRVNHPTDAVAHAISAELKKKLEVRRALQE